MNNQEQIPTPEKTPLAQTIGNFALRAMDKTGDLVISSIKFTAEAFAEDKDYAMLSLSAARLAYGEHKLQTARNLADSVGHNNTEERVNMVKHASVEHAPATNTIKQPVRSHEQYAHTKPSEKKQRKANLIRNTEQYSLKRIYGNSIGNPDFISNLERKRKAGQVSNSELRRARKDAKLYSKYEREIQHLTGHHEVSGKAHNIHKPSTTRGTAQISRVTASRKTPEAIEHKRSRAKTTAERHIMLSTQSIEKRLEKIEARKKKRVEKKQNG